MANLRRIKNNILNRDWKSKSMKTNIDYIKRQLKQFGLSAPKYLNSSKKLTEKQIKNQSKRIVKEIEKQIYQPKAKTMEKALEELREVQQKHNEKLYRSMEYMLNKHLMSENQINYVIGREVGINGYKRYENYTFHRGSTNFTFEDSEGEFYSSVEAVEERINQVKYKTRHIGYKDVDKLFKNNPRAKRVMTIRLDNYFNDSHITSNARSLIYSKVNRLNGLQQEILAELIMQSDLKLKYIVPKDDLLEFKGNLLNKIDRLIDLSEQFS